MLVHADFYLGEFMDMPNYPELLIAYARLRGIPFMVLVVKGCNDVGVTSINGGDDKVIETQIVPHLRFIRDKVNQKLVSNFK